MSNLPNDCLFPSTAFPSKSLQGNLVSLEPLVWEHINELLRFVGDRRIWEFTSHEAGTEISLHRYLATALEERDARTSIPFVVRWRETGKLIGFTNLKAYSKLDRRASVGSWFVPAAWGSGANAESKLLLLDLAFQHLGCQRIEFYTDTKNARSQAALIAIGAIKEGVLRSHSLNHLGVWRDSALYSILQGEWPTSRLCLMRNVEAVSVSGTPLATVTEW
jgi:RimJ/RimL family protein N-acetyltransferase